MRTYTVSVETVVEGGDGVEDGGEVEEIDAAKVGPETGRAPGPYEAETYPVSVEQQMIFVEI